MLAPDSGDTRVVASAGEGAKISVNTGMRVSSSLATMQFLNIKKWGVPGVLGALMLAGCGGGASPTPGNNGPFALDGYVESSDFYDRNDDRFYDIYLTEIARNGTAQVDMVSYDIDSQLYIYRRDSRGDYNLVDQDDDGGDGPDALVRFNVRRGEIYRIVATSSRAQEIGPYRIFFSRPLGRPAIVPVDATNRVAPGLDLPAIQAKGEPKKRAAK